jgi:hypothetical protein
MADITILCPTGHLGFTPLEPASFREGCKLRPDFVIADSGSCDIGPYPLGADGQASPAAWQRHDLEVMLVEARRLGVPMIIGSASDTGTDRGVRQFAEMIRDIARQHGLARFRMATIFSELSREQVLARMAAGDVVAGLDGRPDADAAQIARTDHIVAVMGAEPIAAALREGADVVIAGRSSDCAIFAAPLLNAGMTPATAYYAGKLMECASFCCEPFMGKESIFGRISEDDIRVTAMHPGQRCTPTSLAAHAMYERRDPFREYVASGHVDMTAAHYAVFDEKTARAGGARFVPSPRPMVKLEGAGKVGERRLAIVGIRDPYTIENLDKAMAWARARLSERFGAPETAGWTVHYHVYGRDAVMGVLDPTPALAPHEVGVVVETVCQDAAQAEVICALAARNLFYARLAEVKGTAGAAALMSDEILTGKPGYEWTLNHVLPVSDPAELFRTEFCVVDGSTALQAA